MSATFAGQSIVILFLINKIQVEVDSTVWDFKMWLLAVLMGDHINEGLLPVYENVWPFHKKSGRNYNQVTASTTEVAVSRGSTILQNVTRYKRSCDNNNDGISM